MLTNMFKIPEPKPFDKLLSLEGKTAIVTGGGRGLGKYVVRRFSEAGANVVFCARHMDQLQSVADEYANLPGKLKPVTADISKSEDRDMLINTAIQEFGGIDILVNCAAIYPPGPALSVDEKTWDAMHDIDTKATFFISTAAARQMIKQGRGGRIINFLSTAFVNSSPMFAAYAAAKAGVWSMTKEMAKEFAQYRITVNAVTPGATLTEEKAAALAGGDISSALDIKIEGNIEEMLSKLTASGGAAKMLKERMPMGRMGYPEDIANAVLYFASPMAEYVTGQNIVVDGSQADNSQGLPDFGSPISSTVEAGTDPINDAPAAPTSNEPDDDFAGKWKATVDSPMGAQNIELDVALDGTKVKGTAVFMDKKVDIQEGSAVKDGFTCKIQAKVMMRKLEISIAGKRDGDTISGTISNKMGTFNFKGNRG